MSFSFEEIDVLAEQYQVTRDQSLEGRFITMLDPYLFTVASTCFTRLFPTVNSNEDLFQELRIESLRLFRQWKPPMQLPLDPVELDFAQKTGVEFVKNGIQTSNLKFNYLLRRQIGNFCINSYVYAIAKKRNRALEKDVDVTTIVCMEKDILKDIEDREILEKVFKVLKQSDQKILVAVGEGYPYGDISKEFNISTATITNLKKRARKIIIALLSNGKGEVCEKEKR